jgi:amino acid adenylation domain-containing protein
VSYNLARPFYENYRVHPERTALVVDGDDYSYAQLAEGAAAIARALETVVRGAEAPRVCLVSGRHFSTYAGLLGICWAGAAYVPINGKWPEARVRGAIEAGRPLALVVDDDKLDDLPPGIAEALPTFVVGVRDHAITIGNGAPPATGDGEELGAPAAMQPTDEAYTVFTSGTTAHPTGVSVSCGAVHAGIDNLTTAHPVFSTDRFSQFFDLSFDFSVMDVFVPLGAGARVYVVPEHQRMGPAHFISTHRLTVWTSVPSLITMMQRLRMLKPGALSTLRLSCFGGELLTEGMASAWHVAAPDSHIVNLYGQTEAPIGSFTHVWRPDAEPESPGVGVPIGQPLPGVRWQLADGQRNLVPGARHGELVISGAHLASGYLDDPERTGDRFCDRRDPEAGTRRWFYTGDNVSVDDDGNLSFLGRNEHEVKIAGHRVSLSELEAQLREVVGGAPVAAIGWPVRDGVCEGIVAFVAAQEPDESTIRRALRGRIPAHAMPHRIDRVKILPVADTGKVDRRALAAKLDRTAGPAGVRG